MNATPSAAATYACPTASAPAQLIDGEIPDAPAGSSRSGTVVVDVTLAADGSIRAMAVKRSSGSAALDAAALRGAKASTFAPPCKDAKAVAGHYLYVTTFGHPKQS